MPTPNFDIPTFVKHALPPSYRLPKWIAAVQSFLYGLTWRYKIFQAYQGGDMHLEYNPGIAYSTGDPVAYNYATYESLLTGNVNNQPDYTPAYSSSATYAIGNCVINAGVYYVCNTTISSGEAFNPVHWTAINGAPWTPRCPSFIGANERVKYNGRYLTLTWALNRQFGTTFRQPPYPAPYGGSGAFSDIYITNTPILFTTFAAAPLSAGSSSTGLTASSAFASPSPEYGTASTYQFIVHVPAAIYNLQGSSDSIRQSVFNAFVTKYAASGLDWTVVTY